MKKLVLVLLYPGCAAVASAQNEKMLLCTDTTLLMTEECKWLIHSIPEKDKTVSCFLLDAVQSGQLKASDTRTNERIPANMIYHWNQPVDTLMEWNAQKQMNEMKISRHKVNPTRLNRIRIYFEWHLNTSSGKLETQVTYFELLEEKHTTGGTFLGYTTFCRLE